MTGNPWAGGTRRLPNSNKIKYWQTDELEGRLIIATVTEVETIPNPDGTIQTRAHIEIIDAHTGKTLNPRLFNSSIVAENLMQRPIGTHHVGRIQSRISQKSGYQYYYWQETRSDAEMDAAQAAYTMNKGNSSVAQPRPQQQPEHSHQPPF